MNHHRHCCHALGCETPIPARLHMCPRHWALVPHTLQRRLWAAYVPGQEIRKDPTSAYFAAAVSCVCAVAVAEGHLTPDQAATRLDRIHHRSTRRPGGCRDHHR